MIEQKKNKKMWSISAMCVYSMILFFYTGKTGFVAQRLLPTTKGLSSIKTAPGQKRVLRMGSMGLKRGSYFPWAKRYIKEGSGKRNLSPLVDPLG